MSPVRNAPPYNSRMLLIAAAAIVVGVGLLWAASAALTSRHNSRTAVTASGGVVELGNAGRLAAQFQRGGDTPMYFPDVSGNAQRSVYLVHDGSRSSEGWTAFRAQVPGEAASCQWEWDTDAERFDASCDPERHADARGADLEQYPVRVVDGKLRIDFRASPDND